MWEGQMEERMNAMAHTLANCLSVLIKAPFPKGFVKLA